MNARLTKPGFKPAMICSCIFLAVMMYSLIGGMLSNRFEDILIASLTGFILFLATTFVKNNATEVPKMAVFLMFFWPAVAIAALILMVNNLSEVEGSVGQVFNYGQELWEIFRRELENARTVAANAREVARNTGNSPPITMTLRGAFMSGRVFNFPENLVRQFFLSQGIITGVLFLAAQTLTCVLLFVGTKPEKKEFRH